jgi:aspartyl-tRNA(Asn)/glutamyl-tRNA(Gln) amidotransferase subunit C
MRAGIGDAYHARGSPANAAQRRLIPRPGGLSSRRLGVIHARAADRASARLPGKTRLCYRARTRGRLASAEEASMSVDASTVRRIAHLARIAIGDDEIARLQGELNAILAFVEQLAEVDVKGVEPMTSVTPMTMKKRDDVVTDGGDPDAILKNAPAREGNYFVVPKVVE